MFDTLLLRPSLHCNTPLHFTTLHLTTLLYTSLHFTQLHFTTLIDTSFPLIYTSLPFRLALRIYISYHLIIFNIWSKTDSKLIQHFKIYFNLRWLLDLHQRITFHSSQAWYLNCIFYSFFFHILRPNYFRIPLFYHRNMIPMQRSYCYRNHNISVSEILQVTIVFCSIYCYN
jgi:hypothetical protein